MSNTLARGIRPIRRWAVVYAYRVHKPYGDQIVVEHRQFWTRGGALVWMSEHERVNLVTSHPFNTHKNRRLLSQVILEVYRLTDYLQTHSRHA